MISPNLRIAIVTLFSMAACAAVCPAQSRAGATVGGWFGGQSTQAPGNATPGDSTSTDSTSTGSASAIDSTSAADATTADDSTTAATPTTGASQWTAGRTSFGSASGWGVKAYSTTSAEAWTPESKSFAEPVQPGGIWHATGGTALSSASAPHFGQPSSTEMLRSAYPLTHSSENSLLHASSRSLARPHVAARHSRLAGINRGGKRSLTSHRPAPTHGGSTHVPGSTPRTGNMPDSLTGGMPDSLSGLGLSGSDNPASLLKPDDN